MALVSPMDIEIDLRWGRADTARLMQSIILALVLSRSAIGSSDVTGLSGEDRHGSFSPRVDRVTC